MKHTENAKDLSDPNTWRNMPREDLQKLLNDGIRIPKRGGGFYTFKASNPNSLSEASKQGFKGRGR